MDMSGVQTTSEESVRGTCVLLVQGGPCSSPEEGPCGENRQWQALLCRWSLVGVPLAILKGRGPRSGHFRPGT